MSFQTEDVGDLSALPNIHDRDVWANMIDDAAIFPPGDLSLTRAIPAHCAHRQAWYGSIVGPFVCPVGRLDDVDRIVDDINHDKPDDYAPFAIDLLTTIDHLAEALGRLRPSGRLALAAVEILPSETPLKDVVDQLDFAALGPLPVAIEVPPGPAFSANLDILAQTPYAAKLRTGGTQVAAFPGESELATAIRSATNRGVRFKCTAGLHHAARHTDPQTWFEHHGFLNVLTATIAAGEGGGLAEVARVLAERDAHALAARIWERGTDAIRTARQTFLSIGSCSISDPVHELTALRLLTPPTHEAPT